MADKTKIWRAIPWWIFSWGGRAGANPRLHSQILTPPRLTRNLLLILITPREWIGRNIRQIDLSYIFYLHIPVTESQAHFLSLYFFICFRGSWGCSTPLGPHSRLQAWVLPPELKEACQEGRGEARRRGGWLCAFWFRVRRDPSLSLPSLSLLHVSSWVPVPSPVLGPGEVKTLSGLHHSALCFMGTVVCIVFCFNFLKTFYWNIFVQGAHIIGVLLRVVSQTKYTCPRKRQLHVLRSPLHPPFQSLPVPQGQELFWLILILFLHNFNK